MPLLADMKQWLEKALGELSAKSALAQAIRYSLTRWTALTRYAHDGRLEIDNNAAERALRPLVLKRKISGPTRSRRGDQFLSYGYTAYETCRRQGRDLWHFMHGAVHALIAGTAPPSLIPQAAPTG